MTARNLIACLALTLATTGPALAQGGDASFTLVNRGGAAIRQVFVTPAGDANWGRNRLNGHALAPGASFVVRRRADGNCIMDIRAVFADGHTDDRRGLNTCNVDAVAIGTGIAANGSAPSKEKDDPSFRFVNRGSQAIKELFATPAGDANWGQNRLDEGPLPAASEKLIRITKTGNCLFDLRVVFADGKAVEKHRSDLCRITDLPVP